MSKVQVVARRSIPKEPVYSGCRSDSLLSACPTSRDKDECRILEVYFTDISGSVIKEITYEDEVFLVLKTENLVGEDVIVDFSAQGGEFAYNDELIGPENVLQVTVGAPEENILLEPIPWWLLDKEEHSDNTPPPQQVPAPPDTSIKLLVTEADGPQGQELEADVHYDFWVQSFNRSFLPEEAKMVKWMWKIEGGYNVQCYGESLLVNVDGVFMPGIKLSWNPNFIGKKVYVMPYMNSPGEAVSVLATIGAKRTVKFYDSQQRDLFSLVDDQYIGQRLPAQEFFSKHAKLPERRYVTTQWFEPLADDHKPLSSVESGIENLDTLKHFTWKDIADFADINRGMVAYQQGKSGDWKSVAASGYGLVTVNNKPLRADAVGQIPFTVECFKMFLMQYGDTAKAIRSTLKIGMVFGKGNPWSITLERPEQGQTKHYDNFFVLRGLSYASELYKPGELFQPPPTGPDTSGSSFYILDRDTCVEPDMLGTPVGPTEHGWLMDVYENWDEIEVGVDVHILEALVVAANYWNIPYSIDFWKNWWHDFRS